MARGWESKSVESQMEDRREPKPRGDESTDRDRLERTRKREGLESTRRGIARELEATHSDLRRQSLQAALKHLDDEIGKLG